MWFHLRNTKITLGSKHIMRIGQLDLASNYRLKYISRIEYSVYSAFFRQNYSFFFLSTLYIRKFAIKSVQVTLQFAANETMLKFSHE